MDDEAGVGRWRFVIIAVCIAVFLGVSIGDRNHLPPWTWLKALGWGVVMIGALRAGRWHLRRAGLVDSRSRHGGSRPTEDPGETILAASVEEVEASADEGDGKNTAAQTGGPTVPPVGWALTSNHPPGYVAPSGVPAAAIAAGIGLVCIVALGHIVGGWAVLGVPVYIYGAAAVTAYRKRRPKQDSNAG